jgi:pimeloyl-ACP methyl ester carboxylesterase
VLISGSGPQERDAAIFGHKHFLVLADYLTRQGIAVLRYDDRGTGKSTGVFDTCTSKDFAGDVKSAVIFLQSRKEINKKKIGLVGASEGGLIAPMVAAGSKNVAFIVMLAGPGVPGDEILIEQSASIASANGASKADVKKLKEINRKIYTIVKSGRDIQAISADIRATLTSIDSTARSNSDAIDAQIAQITTPWMRFFLSHDPRPVLKKVTCPVLALNGSKDAQVAAEQNLVEIEKALRAGGNKDATVRELPGLNHLFQTAVKGTPDEYGRIEETFSLKALTFIGDWILKKTGPSSR